MRVEAKEEGFSFSEHDFERVRTLIYRQAGISLNPGKQSMVYSRLARRLRHTGATDFRSYLDRLEAEPAGGGEWQEFVNALTTNLTSFWRESHHFPILAEHVASRARERPVALWCCAASTGEEPYTMAITAMQACASRTPPVTILATDIDTAVLDKAQTGIYGEEAVARVARGALKEHFLRGRGPNKGLVRMRPEVQALVRFRRLNLLDERWPIDTRFDAIFCRNVMIYFDKQTQYRVLHALAARLAPDGLLFAGHSENFTQARDLFELQGRTVYRLAAGRR
ncbi:MAG: chemotaxis protein CheR [Proteobacteria bacterium]|nr:chemotaxis protein CheR [Pseudomonadota bacterium]